MNSSPIGERSSEVYHGYIGILQAWLKQLELVKMLPI